MASDRQNRLAIVQFGRLLHGNGFVAATDGNLSVRLDENRLLVTPTCLSKGRMRASDMVIVDMDGKRLAGKRRVSTEIGMPLLIYRLLPDVHGIVPVPPPAARAAGRRICRSRLRSDPAAGVRGRRRSGLDPAGPLRHTRHARADRCP